MKVLVSLMWVKVDGEMARCGLTLGASGVIKTGRPAVMSNNDRERLYKSANQEPSLQRNTTSPILVTLVVPLNSKTG